MGKEKILFDWLKSFKGDVLSYRINYLPGNTDNQKKVKGVPIVPISLDDVNVTTLTTYVGGDREQQMTYILQLNQKLHREIGDINTVNYAIRDDFAKWLEEQQEAANFPEFEWCGGFRIDTEPQLEPVHTTA